jgi:hypothetical protein
MEKRLLLKKETDSDRSATGLMSKMLSRLFPFPPIKVQTTPVHLRKRGNPMRKTHLTQG